MSNIREALRAHARPKLGPLAETPDGIKFYVRAFSGADRARYLELMDGFKDKPGQIPFGKIAAMGLCDEKGVLLYDAEKPEDVAEVSEFDGDFLQNAVNALFELSGLTKQAADEAAKKSEASPSTSSGTSSPATSSTAP